MARLIPAEPLDEACIEALMVLRSGGTVVLPTDTVYGVGALPDRLDAIAAIFALKQRPPGMHLAVLLAGPEQLPLVSTDDRPGVGALAHACWPGALTMVLRGATPLVAGLGERDGSVGVRCPDHELVRSLARLVGPLAVTSANRHGEPTPVTAAEVAEQLPGVDLVIDGGRCPGGVASTVVDLLGDRPKVLRSGPVDEETITRAWGV
jgi:L-threonylcarbamoyladenylate synthase